MNYSLEVSKLGQSEGGNPHILFCHTILTASVNRNIFPGKKKKKKGPDNNPSLYSAIGGGKKGLLFDLLLLL